MEGHFTSSFLLCIGFVTDGQGSPLECKYSLRSYGIPADQLPTVIPNVHISENPGALKNHRKWLAMRIATDEAILQNIRFPKSNNATNCPSIFDVVECPHHEDCLFGKGETIMKHPGNVAMRELLNQRGTRYEQAAFKEKKAIAKEVVMEIKQGGGRFLREDTNHGYFFVEVDDETARQKVSNALRDVVQRMRRVRERKRDEEKEAGIQRRRPLSQEIQQPPPRAGAADESSGGTSKFLHLSDDHELFPKRRKVAFEDGKQAEGSCIDSMFCGARMPPADSPSPG